MNKENNERIEKIKDFIRDKGVYLVLMLCMAVIGIAAAAAYLPPKGVVLTRVCSCSEMATALLYMTA